jgi:predicted kinase
VKAHPSFSRLSVDAIIADRHGIYNVDYRESEYDTHSEEARKLFDSKFQDLLGHKRNIILDRSFYAKQDRDEFRAAVKHAGGRVVLIYLKAERDLLWKRICERRRKEINADSAREISSALLDQFVQGFEAPGGEGEIVVDIGA